MAQRTQVILIDDLDNTEITDGRGQTVRFGLNNSVFELDLSPANAERLYAALEPFVAKARKVGSMRSREVDPPAAVRARSGRSPVRTDPSQLAAVRSWARENGHQVSDRGRVPREVQEAFEAAHQQ